MSISMYGISVPAYQQMLTSLDTILGKAAHQATFVISILQPIKKHMVDHLPMPDARPTTHFRQKIRRI